MRDKRHFFDRIPNTTLFLAIISVLFVKVIIYILIKSELLNISLGGGSDANYYDRYAQGITQIAVNVWPLILRYLYNIGLYSREAVSHILFFLSISVIPTLVCKLTHIEFKENQKYYFYCFLIILIYPTIYFYATDVYRDVFMVFIFLLGCLMVRRFVYSTNALSYIINFSICVLIGIFLLGLRPYLGYAFLLSMFLWKIRFTKKRLVFLGALYLIALFFLNYLGFFNVLTEYRAGFEESEGGSTLGLDFSNPILFIPNFILSTLGQLFGLYITNPLAIVLLLIETAPLFFMLIYVIKNVKLADSFVRFLIIFFVLYASVWLIGNDNLGTAVRLRIYNYLAIYISFFYILRLKKLYSATSEVVSK